MREAGSHKIGLGVRVEVKARYFPREVKLSGLYSDVFIAKCAATIQPRGRTPENTTSPSSTSAACLAGFWQEDSIHNAIKTSDNFLLHLDIDRFVSDIL